MTLYVLLLLLLLFIYWVIGLPCDAKVLISINQIDCMDDGCGKRLMFLVLHQNISYPINYLCFGTARQHHNHTLPKKSKGLIVK